MDLSRFHYEKSSKLYRRIMDKLNSATGLVACEVLDRQGWYNLSLSSRLLGHYRLHQHYKKSTTSEDLRLPSTHRYIIQRKKNKTALRYRPYTILNILSAICLFPTPSEDIYTIDNQLVTTHTDILYEFLTHAEKDFETALANAITAIHKPDILSEKPTANIQPVIEIHSPHENLPGKQKNIFSKKQVLVLFDVLSQSEKKLERIDLQKANKFPDFATFLQALTGKTQETWIEELKNYNKGDLYKYNTPAELNQLINTLTNLADILRKAGFRTLATQIDKKIRELETKKNLG